MKGNGTRMFYRSRISVSIAHVIDKRQKLKRALLWIPARLYELGVRLRVAAYETHYLKPKRLNATVISVGNITLGGTGKTPLVDYIARYLESEGHSVAILTRGYARRSSGRRVLNEPKKKHADVNGSVLESSAENASLEASQSGAASRNEELDAELKSANAHLEFGDEPVMLARALPGVPIIIDKDRYRAGKWAEREIGSQALILDDGYQHLALARDLNILLLDATDPFGGFEMVPFGRLREPLYGINRADAIIITRADRPFDQGQVIRAIKEAFSEKMPPVMYVYSSITSLRHLADDAVYEANQFVGWNAALMCGIGNPFAFADDILQIGMNIVSENFFADHHAFTQAELDRVSSAAGDAGADAIITTEKDAVRLAELAPGDVPVYAARIEIQSEDEVRLKSLLLRALVKKRED